VSVMISHSNQVCCRGAACYWGQYCCLHAVCVGADGSELVTGIGSRVLVYETTAGDLLHSLHGHKV
jgi:hypothetical protein